MPTPLSGAYWLIHIYATYLVIDSYKRIDHHNRLFLTMGCHGCFFHFYPFMNCFGRNMADLLSTVIVVLTSNPPKNVHLLQRIDNSTTQEKFVTSMNWHAIVTILVRFGALHGRPLYPSLTNFHQVNKDMYSTHQEL